MAKNLFEIQEGHSKQQTLKGKYNLSWVEESAFLENQDKNRRMDTAHTSVHLGVSLKRKKIYKLIIVIFVVFCIIFGRIFYLQIIKGQDYRVLAEGNRIRLKAVASERGVIYDKYYKQLVQNVPNFSLAIIPQDLPSEKLEPVKRKQVIKQVVKIAGIEEKMIIDLLEKYGNYSYASLVIKENLDYETALKLYIKSDELPGIVIEKGSKRKYLFLESNNKSSVSSTLSLSHILGYEGKLNNEEYEEKKDSGYLLFDNIGKTGLEKIYETKLRGNYGLKKIEVDAGGHEQNVLAEIPPSPGENLILSLDLEAQSKLESLIEDMSIRKGGKRVAGIVLNPTNGGIIALVSWPAFNNNDFSGGISQTDYNKYLNNNDRPLFNRAISGTYPSGSTVKMVVAAAALQENIINSQTVFLSSGGLRIDKWFFNDWQAGGHGLTNVRRAIAWSVNTFFYYIGGGYENFVGLGVEKITKYMGLFNLGSTTGIDLPSEEAGFLPSKEWKQKAKNEIWYIGDTYNLSIGQGDLLVTPLQVAVWTAAVANGGKIVQPHFVEKIENSTTKTTIIPTYKTKETGISAINMNIVKQGMGDCVGYGSCQLMKMLSFNSGGKTGTAQWNTAKNNHSWYTSFAPFDDPQIVVTILIEEGDDGSSETQTIAYNFLKWWGEKYKIK
jgi:penicillin-binding protein 2